MGRLESLTVLPKSSTNAPHMDEGACPVPGNKDGARRFGGALRIRRCGFLPGQPIIGKCRSWLIPKHSALMAADRRPSVSDANAMYGARSNARPDRQAR